MPKSSRPLPALFKIQSAPIRRRRSWAAGPALPHRRLRSEWRRHLFAAHHAGWLAPGPSDARQQLTGSVGHATAGSSEVAERSLSCG